MQANAPEFKTNRSASGAKVPEIRAKQAEMHAMLPVFQSNRLIP